jgi:hypothetical protein
MFCPDCGVEYREGYTRCADCDVDLVEEPPPVPELPSGELVAVLETGDHSLVMVARGILESAGIPYFAKNDQLQSLFGLGRFGSGFNIATGPVKVLVPREDDEAARALLTKVSDEESDA